MNKLISDLNNPSSSSQAQTFDQELELMGWTSSLFKDPDESLGTILEKKRKNVESSARHRAKKKAQEILLRESLETAEKEMEDLKRENAELKKEISYLRRLILDRY